MSTQQLGELRCPACGSTHHESIVQYGSYSRRCASCKSILYSASWTAVGPQWEGRIRVYRDDNPSAAPLLEGIGHTLVDPISKLAADGTKLLLQPVKSG